MCPYCGARALGPRRDTHYALIGGVFSILSGVFGMLVGAIILAVGSTFFINIPAWGLICGAIPLIFGFIALLGGYCAIQRRSFGIAVLGAIFAIFLTVLFGIIAVVFTIMGKDEFQ
jgi:uncharacterized protein YacL